jgi:CRP-like cAMP-binding protein
MSTKFNKKVYSKLIPQGEILSADDVDMLMTGGRTIRFSRKDMIFRQGTLTSHVMYLESGLIKIFKTGKNEKSMILKIATPGYFIGLVSIFGNSSFQYSAQAIEDSSVFFIDINTFNDILKNNGNYAHYILQVISSDNLNIFERILSQYQKQLPGKIADIILYFSEEIYKKTEFSFPLTRNELAELAGTTKESFIRTLTEFKNDKIIEIDGKLIKINSIDIVKTLSRLG